MPSSKQVRVTDQPEPNISRPTEVKLRMIEAGVARHWIDLWIYFTAPIIGMLSAVELYLRTNRAAHIGCAKLHHQNRERCIFCGAHAATSRSAFSEYVMHLIEQRNHLRKTAESRKFPKKVRNASSTSA